MKMKREYKTPHVQSLGSVEDVTGWVGGGSGEFFGGTQQRSTGPSTPTPGGGGVADLGS